jgi:HSP20 family protein
MRNGLTKSDKLPVFSSFQNEMNRRLDNFFNRESSYGTDWRPKIDVAETESDIIVKAETPGIDPKDVDISITGDTLILKGEKKEGRFSPVTFYLTI